MRDDVTMTSNIVGGGPGFMGMGSNSVTQLDPSMNLNEDARYGGQRSGRGPAQGYNQGSTPGISAFVRN